MAVDAVDDVPPMAVDAVDRVVVVGLEMLQPFVEDRLGGAAGADGAGDPTEGVELEEFSRRSCCTCRMSTYSSRLAFGLVRLEIPVP